MEVAPLVVVMDAPAAPEGHEAPSKMITTTHALMDGNVIDPSLP